MSLAIDAKTGKMIETIRNYAINADTTIERQPDIQGYDMLYDDENFWFRFLKRPEDFWNRSFDLYGAVVSDWVARIPGLYWTPESEKLRQVNKTEIEHEGVYRSKNWVTYSPIGKSMKVMGGLGTFVLPPDDEGKTIMSLSFSNNASTGIPVLVYPEVIEHFDLKQGDVLKINKAFWRKMSLEWSNKFDASGAVKRGYLVLDKPEQVTIMERGQPVELHPFTIMEYSAGDAMLYDYVFCTIDSHYDKYRKEVETFFENYRKSKDRYGKYLIPADSNNPFFEAEYNSPADLLRATPDGKSQLNLLLERIQNNFYHKGETIQTIMEKIPKHYPTSNDIITLAIELGLPPALLQVGAANRMSAQLVDICRERKLLTKLVDHIDKK